MEIKIPLAFNFVELDMTVTPGYTAPDRKFLVPDLSRVKIAYHGYQIELTLGALKSVVDAVERELEKLKG